MASPTKPPSPINPVDNAETEREFGAAVERVQRRQTTPSRKGFDEERQSDEQTRHGTAQDNETAYHQPASPGAWTPFSDDD